MLRSENTRFLYHGPQKEADDITSYSQFEEVAKKVGAGAPDAPSGLLYMTVSVSYI